MDDLLTGTVKGPGILPHEYLFITRDNDRTRVGEFVHYEARIGDERRPIVGTITSRKLVRNLPDAFLADPATPPAAVASLIGIEGDLEIYEVTVSTIGYFSEKLGDFVNPRIPPQPGDPVYIASSETLAGMLSPRKTAESGSAHIGSLLTREPGDVPVVLSVRDVVSTHLAILASTGAGKSYTAGVLVEERRLGVHDADDHHRSDASQSGGDPVDPLGRDERVADDEDRDGGGREDQADLFRTPRACAELVGSTCSYQRASRP